MVTKYDDISFYKFEKTDDNEYYHLYDYGSMFIGCKINNILISFIELISANVLGDHANYKYDIENDYRQLLNIKSLINESYFIVNNFPNHPKKYKHHARILLYDYAKSKDALIKSNREYYEMGLCEDISCLYPNPFPKYKHITWKDIRAFESKNDKANDIFENYKEALYANINNDMYLYHLNLNKKESNILFREFYDELYKSCIEAKDAPSVKDIDQAICTYRFSKMCVYQNKDINDYKIGEVFYAPTYFSVTVGKYAGPVLNVFCREHTDNVLFNVIIPPEFLHLGIQGNSFESEMILPPGTGFKVIDVKYGMVRKSNKNFEPFKSLVPYIYIQKKVFDLCIWLRCVCVCVVECVFCFWICVRF